MDFGDALRAIRRDGYVVRRAGWGSVVLGITCFPPLEDGRLSIIRPDGTYAPFGGANADLLAEDWEIAGADPSFSEGRVPLCPGCLAAPERALIVRLT